MGVAGSYDLMMQRIVVSLVCRSLCLTKVCDAKETKMFLFTHQYGKYLAYQQ